MILSRIENLIVDDMTNKQVRYIEPVVATKADGELYKLYAQIRSDFQLVPPLTLFSPAPDLLAGVWSIWRESQFVMGQVPRFITEAVAAAISSINTCPYCVDAHTGMLHASSNSHIVDAIHRKNSSLIKDQKSRRILEWAFANRSPGDEILARPPFSKDEAPEIIGTAFVYHLVNRMVTVFLVDTPLPVSSNWKYIRRIAAKIFGLTVGKSIINRRPQSDQVADLAPINDLPDSMNWALSNLHIARAFSNFSILMQSSTGNILSEQVRNLAERQVNSWSGENMGMDRSWLEKNVRNLEEIDKPVARLILLTALSPYQVCEKDILEFRSVYPDDERLLIITTWASFIAARRVSSWLFEV